MTASPIPDAAVEAYLRAEYTAHLVADTGLPADDSVIRRRVDERIARCRVFPGVWEQTRAGLAAVYPLMRAQREAERGAASEWALWAARQALDVAADGTETEFTGGAA